ncbi:MAG: GNAT family N-acetyltransferase [Pseudomonadota bacterium]
MAIETRMARAEDAAGMADVLGPIIEAGGLTAMEGPVHASTFDVLFEAPDPRLVLHVIEEAGRILGFQWVEPHPDLPHDVGDMATFVSLDQGRRGLGARLFAASLPAARAAGWRRLNAVVRPSNPGALSYYRAMGFCEAGEIEGRRILRRGVQPSAA